MRHLNGVVIVVALGLAGCATSPHTTGDSVVVSVDEHAPVGPLQFIDTDQFDDELSKALKDGGTGGEVTVVMMAPFSVNAIPERAKKWFSTITSSDGKVTVESDQRMLFLSALGMFPNVNAMIKEYTVYRPAQHYNAVMVAGKDGMVSKIIFRKKPE